MNNTYPNGIIPIDIAVVRYVLNHLGSDVSEVKAHQLTLKIVADLYDYANGATVQEIAKDYDARRDIDWDLYISDIFEIITRPIDEYRKASISHKEVNNI